MYPIVRVHDERACSIFDNRLKNLYNAMTEIISTKSLEEILKRISQPYDPTWYMVTLERAANSKWILSTSEVKQLIGVEPRIKKGKNTFKRGCFVFIKCGKVGNQTGWRVMKKIEAENPYQV